VARVEEANGRWEAVLRDWGDELPALHLNYFAERLPAAYYRDHPGRYLDDFPVLKPCLTRAKVRRGCFAGAVALARDTIAADIYYCFDDPQREATDPEWGGGYWAGRYPAAYSSRYDRDFHLRLLGLAIGLWDRMEDGSFGGASCTTEQILLSIIFEDYAARLDDLGLGTGAVDLEDLWLVDEDYLLLYDDSIAEHEQVLLMLETKWDAANLRFTSWFEPFYDSVPVAEAASDDDVLAINGM